MNSRVAVVANTSKLGGKQHRELRGALVTHGLDDAAWYQVDKGRRAAEAAEKAVKRGADVVVVAGGDGTVRAASSALVGTDVAMAVVPAGTANLLASGLHLPPTSDEVIAAVVAGHTVALDSGTCNGRTFNVMAGSGFDAAMIDAADDGKERWGTLAYVRAGVREARHRQPFAATVAVDGDTVFEGEVTCVLVANLGSLKAGVDAFPDADPHDGLLDVAVVTAAGMREWAALMARAVRGSQRWSGHVQFGRGSGVDIRFADRHRFELDGGCKGTAKHLEFGVRPGALRLCVSPGRSTAAADIPERTSP